MKAVVYGGGTKTVRVEDVEDSKLEHPNDAILKVTSSAICGSDLHMYEGRTPAEEGKVFGHEIMGVIDQVGDGMQQLQKGDRVVLPFNIACGTCNNCVHGFPNLCYFYAEGADAAAAFGYAGMGPYRGGQAEYVRVPSADFNSIKLPGKPGDEYEDGFLMIADIFPTAYHACLMADVSVGKSTVIYGAGPVGLLSVMCAVMLGAGNVYVVDHYPDRLEKAKELGAIPINSDDGNPVEQIRKHREYIKPAMRIGEDMVPLGVPSAIDAVGYQAHDLTDTSQEDHTRVMDDLAELLLPGGALGSIGVYLPGDPGETGPAAEGKYTLPWGKLWYKGVKIGTGQAPAKRYGEYLRNAIVAGHANPGTIVSHHITIDEAPDMYERFDRREKGVRKAVIKFT